MLGFELPHLCSCRPLEAQRNTQTYHSYLAMSGQVNANRTSILGASSISEESRAMQRRSNKSGTVQTEAEANDSSKPKYGKGGGNATKQTRSQLIDLMCYRKLSPAGKNIARPPTTRSACKASRVLTP